MIKRILLLVPVLLVLGVGTFWIVLKFGFFQEKRRFHLHADKTAYAMIVCVPAICGDVGYDEEAADKFENSGLKIPEMEKLYHYKKLPKEQVELLNSITFCFENIDMTPSGSVNIITDTGDGAGMALVIWDEVRFWTGTARDSSVYALIDGLYRPCGWNGEEKFAEFLEYVF